MKELCNCQFLQASAMENIINSAEWENGDTVEVRLHQKAGRTEATIKSAPMLWLVKQVMDCQSLTPHSRLYSAPVYKRGFAFSN